MKAFFLKCLVLLCLVALFIVGLDWVLATSGWVNWMLGENAKWQGIRAIDNIWIAQVAGIALMMLPVLTLFAWILLGRDEHISARAKDGDLIRLRPQAIERVVCRDIRSRVDEVIRVDAFARQGSRHRPKVTVNIAVTDKTPVPQVRSAVRTEAVKVLQHLLGVADTSQVKVVVYDVSGKKLASGGERRRANARKSRPRPSLPSAESK